MRIISNYKDYYDHQVGYHGFDPNIVYDRRVYPTSVPKYDDCYVYCICGERVPFVLKNNKYFFESTPRLDYFQDAWLRRFKDSKTKLNVDKRQPILYMNIHTREVTIPILSKSGFPAFIDAQTMYRKIYDFLSWLKDNPAKPDNMTDKDKIHSHGFDTKRSFRPNIKS